MNNTHVISGLVEELNEFFSKYQNTITPELEEKKESLMESLPLLAPIEDHSYSLIDLNTGKCISHHSIYENTLLHPAISIHQKIHTASWTEFAHPVDLINTLYLAKVALLVINKLPANSIKDFRLSHPIRMKNKDNNEDCFILNYKIALNDANNRPWLVLMHTKRCHLVPAINEKRFRIISVEPTQLFKKKIFILFFYCV